MARVLDEIRSPADLKRLDTDRLKCLAGELREEIVRTVQKNGGHLGANLGAVEIILAVHSVLNSPTDKIIFDVGHQAYAHKLITGRLREFPTLRQYQGLSGFPRREESPHDAFGVGHAGTSISAALGYCLARDARGENYKVVTITGDGAMTAGMAFEALNHAGELDTDLVVILNDNAMSISKNVGALHQYLTTIRTDPAVVRARDEIERIMSRIPAIGGSMMKVAEKLAATVRHVVVPGAMFQDLGWAYYGPIDGHNIPLLQRVLREAISRGGPVLIHAITQKGRGYPPAEEDPGRLHSLKPPICDSDAPFAVTYSEVFGDALLELAKDDPSIVAITAAMPEGTGLAKFAEELPDRFIDVAIAEQHAVTLAAGLACGGQRPVVAIYSTFLQRAYDQIVHDVALQNLPVIFCLDRAGIVGDDGPTHHGVLDLSFLRTFPNMVVMAPRDGAALRDMLCTALQLARPVAIRYPRGATAAPGRNVKPRTVPLGKGEILREGNDAGILAIGSMVNTALSAAELLAARGTAVTVADARFVKPLDEELVLQLARLPGGLVTVEENAVAGGFGSAVLELLTRRHVPIERVRLLGIGDTFVEQGDTERLHRLSGLTAEDIAGAVQLLLNERPTLGSFVAH
ncbi:MAG TPA: 1-deoxy-D-xylulose-5-phosphate synthase [Firmicutes bacterium]|nr:1-deoxy-D-xylulose-5-phosphate synthase [Bacillota bacterium]